MISQFLALQLVTSELWEPPWINWDQAMKDSNLEVSYLWRPFCSSFCAPPSSNDYPYIDKIEDKDKKIRLKPVSVGVGLPWKLCLPPPIAGPRSQDGSKMICRLSSRNQFYFALKVTVTKLQPILVKDIKPVTRERSWPTLPKRSPTGLLTKLIRIWFLEGYEMVKLCDWMCHYKISNSMHSIVAPVNSSSRSAQWMQEAFHMRGKGCASW